MRSKRFLLCFGVVCGGVRAVAGCGDRTGLDVDTRLVPLDASIDVSPDRTVPIPDAMPDVLPDTFDALPPIDASPLPDVFVNDCPDAGATLVYVVTAQNELFSFFPPSGAFKRIGLLACPTPPGYTPFSMAVDRKGTAFVLFSNNQPAPTTSGSLFRVSTLSAACVATPYVPNQNGFLTFGMGFAGNPNGTDALYVASDDVGPSGRLGSIDTATFSLRTVGQFQPQPVARAELTGTGDGRLFAFYALDTTSSAVAQIDPMTAQVTANNNLPNVPQGGGWAFAFWGGDFYLFTAPGGAGTGSNVTRFRPADGSTTLVAQLPTTIVGAGVSTCAPQQ